jgi:hypothetical protein
MPRVFGETKRIARTSRPAGLDHDLSNLRTPGDLPEPTPRVATCAHVPAEVRADLPAHLSKSANEFLTDLHAAGGVPLPGRHVHPAQLRPRPPLRGMHGAARPLSPRVRVPECRSGTRLLRTSATRLNSTGASPSLRPMDASVARDGTGRPRLVRNRPEVGVSRNPLFKGGSGDSASVTSGPLFGFA